MGYLDIQNRENIDAILEKTLSDFYGTKVTVSGKYKKGDFILNPRLNSAISDRAEHEVRTAVLKEHISQKNIFTKIASIVFFFIAFSKSGKFGCKYISFSNMPDNARSLLIMPGNMKIKIFDYYKKNITNILKNDFSFASLEKETKVREKPAFDFILPIEVNSPHVYSEKLMKGLTLGRMEPKKAAKRQNEIRSILKQLQQNNRKTLNCTIYSDSLTAEIRDGLLQIYAKEVYKQSVLDFVAEIRNLLSEAVTVSSSHGDLQNGNIFVDENNKVWILDWETFSERSIGFDLLTYYYKFRYRTDYQSRIRSFIEADDWDEKSLEFYGKLTEKKQVLALYFLEDIDWVIKECLSTREKRISESLLKYADKSFQKAVAELLGGIE